MAVVILNFVKKGSSERSGAKANIKYIQNRLGREKERIRRTLFSAGGEVSKHQAYEMIDQAEEGSTFFRIKISPDPKKEDMEHDLLLREITAKTMDITDNLGRPVTWVASIHDDHTAIRHVHVLGIAHARLLPAQTMRQAATDACREQRRELDAAREHRVGREMQVGKEEQEWQRERSK